MIKLNKKEIKGAIEYGIFRETEEYRIRLVREGLSKKNEKEYLKFALENKCLEKFRCPNCQSKLEGDGYAGLTYDSGYDKAVRMGFRDGGLTCTSCSFSIYNYEFDERLGY